MEIPKDGKAYLAWHIYEGMVNVYWSDQSPAVGKNTKTRESPGYWIYNSDRGPIDGDMFERWMNEKGKWIEIS